MKEWIISFLVSKIGSYAVVALNAGLAMGITKLASVNPTLAHQINEPAVATFIWGSLMSVVNFATNHWLTASSKDIQTALVKVGAKLNIDGWVGDKTVQAFEEKTGIRVEKAISVK